MQSNNLNSIQPQQYCPSGQNPNAVSINIFSPAAYGNTSYSAPKQNSAYQNGFYPLYSSNPIPQAVSYPQNYNNLINYPQQQNNIPQQNQNGLIPSNNNMLSDGTQKTPSGQAPDNKEAKTDKEDKKEKQVIPLTDDYIKSLENYLNSNSSKIRLAGIKEVIERFKEDENRKDNPSLIPLLNKALQDTSPSVRFLALTALQLGYTKGDDKTVTLLNNLVANSKENFGEDASLASEALLKIATPQAVNKEGES